LRGAFLSTWLSSLFFSLLPIWLLHLSGKNIEMSTKKHLVVFSGGSAANNLIDVFKTLASKGNRALDFVLPISDNGGSTSEILRVFGGPGIGDVRSMYPYLHIFWFFWTRGRKGSTPMIQSLSIGCYL
jgi:hypothetical protein